VFEEVEWGFEPSIRLTADNGFRDLWGAQIQFRHAVQDWVKSVNFAHSLRGWVRLTSTPQI